MKIGFGAFPACFHVGFRPLDTAPEWEPFIKVGTADRIVELLVRSPIGISRETPRSGRSTLSKLLNRPLKGADRPTGWCHLPEGT
jgi:hypothetical protein